jgi:hypothetical protein
MTTTITLRTNCCEKGKKHLRYIPEESCELQGIDAPVSAFYVNVQDGRYPDPAWERILFCPFCGNGLVPLVEEECLLQTTETEGEESYEEMSVSEAMCEYVVDRVVETMGAQPNQQGVTAAIAVDMLVSALDSCVSASGECKRCDEVDGLLDKAFAGGDGTVDRMHWLVAEHCRVVAALLEAESVLKNGRPAAPAEVWVVCPEDFSRHKPWWASFDRPRSFTTFGQACFSIPIHDNGTPEPKADVPREITTTETEEESTRFQGVKAARVKLDELDEDGWTEVSPHEHYRSGFAFDEVDGIAREALDEVERLQRGLRGGIACAREEKDGKVTGAYLECVLHDY